MKNLAFELRTIANEVGRMKSVSTLFSAVVLVLLLSASSCVLSVSRKRQQNTMKGKITYLNPEGLHKNPAFSQAVVVSGNTRTIYVGGQNAVDSAGTIVGKGDIGAQTEQVLINIERALASGGARLENVVKWSVYVVEGQPPGPGFAVFQKAWGDKPNPPLISVVFVSALANPDFLVEVEAVAVVPED